MGMSTKGYRCVLYTFFGQRPILVSRDSHDCCGNEREVSSDVERRVQAVAGRD
jgi:hypothetical protein